MQFSGEITTQVEKELRNIYCKHRIRFELVHCFVGLAIAPFAIIILLTADAPAGVIFGIFVLLIAVLIPVIPILIFTPRGFWWSLWWPRFLSFFGRHLLCEVTPNGIQLKPGGAVIKWRDVTATDQTDTMIVIYLGRAVAYPIHRSMAGTASDWADLVNLARKNTHWRSIKHVKT